MGLPLVGCFEIVPRLADLLRMTDTAILANIDVSTRQLHCGQVSVLLSPLGQYVGVTDFLIDIPNKNA